MSHPSKTPSKQAQLIYCRVMIEGRAVEQVAKDLLISVRAARDTVSRVKRWLQQSQCWFPNDERESSYGTLKQLHLARLEHQWEEVMNAWYRSTHMAETQRLATDEAGKKKVEKSLQSQTGEVKYLIQAREILQEIRVLVGPSAAHVMSLESSHVENLSLEQRTAAVDQLLETLGQRAGAEEVGGMDTGHRAAA